MAGAFLAGVRRDGLDPDPELRLLAWPPTEGSTVEDPHGLGEVHQRLLGGDERTRRGVWYTPAWLAAELAGRALEGAGDGLVSDPACGGGAFLLAAAERLGSVEMLWGCDVDPLAVAVTEAALWWWSARRGAAVVVGDRLVVGDALVDVTVPRSAAVVGNPPFLGQLKRSTASGSRRRTALRRRFGDVVRPYTDEAWLFLLAAVDATDMGGRVALVQPRSLLAARDATPVRAAIDERAALVDMWIDDGTTFEAGVHACAPVLQRNPGAARNDWSGSLVDDLGVPPAQLDGAARLGDRADVVAGFRDEYYDLVGAVHEGGDGPRLVTSGAIDPFGLIDAPVRFAKRRWERPTVDVGTAAGRAARWVDAQRAPKILVATQTKVLEAVVDADGSMVGSVPVLVVRPHDPDALWHLAAALHAPVVTAWLLRRTAGTALAPDACKPTPATLAELPLPTDTGAWDEATRLARELARARRDDAQLPIRDASGPDAWAAFGAAADRAYGVTDGTLVDWWLRRLPVR